jgi:hypothetical protein
MLHNRGCVLVAPAPACTSGFEDAGDSFWANFQKLPSSSTSAQRNLAECALDTLAADLQQRWPFTKSRRARKTTLRLGNDLCIPVLVRPAAAQCSHTREHICHICSDAVLPHTPLPAATQCSHTHLCLSGLQSLCPVCSKPSPHRIACGALSAVCGRVTTGCCDSSELIGNCCSAHLWRARGPSCRLTSGLKPPSARRW